MLKASRFFFLSWHYFKYEKKNKRGINEVLVYSSVADINQVDVIFLQ